jgi:hypothetical protein
MHENANLKESMEISRFESGQKFNKESKQGEFVFDRCKTSNVLIIFKVGARVAHEFPSTPYI